MSGIRAPVGAAVRALAAQPLAHRHVARAFALLLEARRAFFFPGDGDIISEVGSDERGTEVRRYVGGSFESHERFVGEGPDGLLPIADADPGHWLTVRLGDKPMLGGVALLGLNNVLTSETLALLDAFVDLAIGRIVADREVRLARHKAQTDVLTGALRRDAVDEVLASMTSYALAFIDLDGFKEINDTQGHDAGDRHLVACAAALQRVVRPGDPVIRWGGDEFIALMASSSVETLEARIRRSLALNKIAASIGVVSVPTEATDFTAAKALADERMYAEKRAPGKKSRK